MTAVGNYYVFTFIFLLQGCRNLMNCKWKNSLFNYYHYMNIFSIFLQLIELMLVIQGLKEHITKRSDVLERDAQWEKSVSHPMKSTLEKAFVCYKSGDQYA